MADNNKRAREDGEEEVFVRPNWYEKVVFNPNTPDDNTDIYHKGTAYWDKMSCPLCAGSITVDKAFSAIKGQKEEQNIHELRCDKCTVADKFGDDRITHTKRYKKVLYPAIPDSVLPLLHANDPARNVLRRLPVKVFFTTKAQRLAEEEKVKSAAQIAQLQQQLLAVQAFMDRQATTSKVAESHAALSQLASLPY